MVQILIVRLATLPLGVLNLLLLGGRPRSLALDECIAVFGRRGLGATPQGEQQ
jgi:hypothetical protein